MKSWFLILVTASYDGSISTEHVASYNFLPSCEYAAKARKSFFTDSYEQFVCLEEPIKSEHQ